MDGGATCTIMTHFEALDDPRVERAKRHDLLDIVTIALCAVLGGADGWVEVEEFGRAKQAWLATFLACNRSEGVQPYAASGSGALSVVGCTGGSSDGDDVPER